VKAFYRGAERSQLRQITGGSGVNGGNNELRAAFGLGDATNAEVVRIEWPSGAVQEFHNVAPRQILTITEPPLLLASASNAGQPAQFSLKGGRFMQYDIQASPDLAAWSSIGTVIVTNLNGTVQIIDTNAPALDHRFYRVISH
jgi:ASPIC and UnbV